MTAATLSFVTRRLAQGVVVVFAVATLVFVLVRAAPGDPLFTVQDRTAPETLERLKRQFGLDRPLPEQYVRFLANLARGDLGPSLAQRRPARDALLDALPNTLLLAVAALLVDFVAGIAIGVFQATRVGRPSDTVLSVATITLYSMPVFWLGLLVLVFFGQHLGWFPTSGVVDAVGHRGLSPLGRVLDRLHHLALPALTMGLVAAGYTARHQRSALLEALQQDFIRTARAKGLRNRVVLVRHALRNALLPAITLAGLALPVLLSGSVLIETVFAWPGIGRLTVEAIFRRDYPIVTGAAILAAVMVVIGNLAADLATRAADPRLRRAA